MAGDFRGETYSRRSSDDYSSADEETSSSLYSAEKDYTPIEWTDEKHSLYLKSMEASFVDQLYNSLGALGRSEDQFKVLRDGFWQKMKLKQPEYRLNGRQGGSHEFLRSPWIKHYKPLPKTQSLVTNEGSSGSENQVVSSGSASSIKQGCSHSRDRDEISIGEEVSDQNFVNEVTKGENGSLKKMKTMMSGSSSTDQVVPLRRTPANMT